KEKIKEEEARREKIMKINGGKGGALFLFENLRFCMNYILGLI
ncbi:unnamed protein product, partial [marine sediment metagenome]